MANNQSSVSVTVNTDSVDRTPELALRSRLTWTELHNSRCVHAITDSVDRTTEVSLHSRIP
jgi:hypothetical protein